MVHQVVRVSLCVLLFVVSSFPRKTREASGCVVLEVIRKTRFGSMPMLARWFGCHEYDAHDQNEEVSFETCVVLRQKTYLWLVWEQEQRQLVQTAESR